MNLLLGLIHEMPNIDLVDPLPVGFSVAVEYLDDPEAIADANDVAGVHPA